VRRGAAAVALALLVAGAARADEEDGLGRTVSSADPAAGGAFSAWTMDARSDGRRGLVFVQGGYDAARGTPTFDGIAEAAVLDRLTLRAGVSQAGSDGSARPTVGARLDVLRQGRDGGADVAVAAAYEQRGFNNVPAVDLTAAVGRRFGGLTVAGDVRLGVGTESGEHYGEAGFAARVRVAPAVHVGADSRVRVDLEHASDPSDEPAWELVAGPQALLSVGRYVLDGGAGVAALRMHGGPAAAGPLVHLGIGAVF
jgi:hypothetical protein